ncbi:MAG: hypothetical protein WC554_10970 [Clostridia bacterium]
MNKDYEICECNEVVFFNEKEDTKLCPKCKKILVHYVDKINLDNLNLEEKTKLHYKIYRNSCPDCGGDLEVCEVAVRCLKCDYEIVAG